MAFNGGNGDFFEGYIYWATSDNPEAGWTVHDLNPSDSEHWTPLLSRYKRDGSPGECGRLGAFLEPKLVYDPTNSNFYLFTSYCHFQSGQLDPCAVRDTWLYRIAYDPQESTGLGPAIQLWKDNGTTSGLWLNTSGRIVFDYDGVIVPGEPTLSYWDGMRDPLGPNVYFRWGAGDLEKDPNTGRWVHIFNHPDASGGPGNRFYSQTTTAVNFRRNRWDAPVEVNVDSVYSQFPDPSLDNPNVRDTYEPGMWFGQRYNRTGWWAYVPVNPLQCAPPYQGLAIAEAELCPKTTPSISSALSPSTGTAGGGTTVAISGANLDCASSVIFDQSLAQFVSRTNSQIVVRTPPHAAGTVSVRVAAPSGQVTRTSAFTFQGSSACTPNSTTLCLQSNRFKVQLVGGSGAYPGYADPYSNEAGSFWFFDSANTEVVVKLLNGTDTNGNFWVFHGPLTDLQYTLTVTDTTRGTVKTYNKPAGSYCGGSDIGSFPNSRIDLTEEFGLTSTSEPSEFTTGTCSPNSTTACFFGNRFKVRAKYTGVYQQIGEASNQSALFWFFTSSRPELMIKIFDGGPLNGKFWLYYGSLTDLAYELEVTDTNAVPAVTKHYSGTGPFCGAADTNAFPSP